MWHLIGIDEDGARHHWNEAETKEEASALLENAMPSLERMKKPYKEDLRNAYKEYLEIKEMPEDERHLHYEYLSWEMQGFFIDHFILEHKEGY
jgi:hypothetical protein